MVVAPRENHTVVMAPYVGAPAYNAGLRPGDVIMKVDEKATDGLTTSEVADLLKGPKGTVVKITVAREGYAEPLVFTVTRDEIPRHSVDIAFLLKPGIGYIRLSGFNETTDREIAEGLKQLNASQLDGLIFDMRGNPGGLLNEAVAVGDMFLDRGQLIVSHHGRSSPNRPYVAVRGNQGVTVPLVILVNNNSASATEIVAGAVQDHDRGLIVGETTFGKGLVQTVTPLSENTGLALTTARYYTPSGRLIQRDYKSISLYEYHYERKVPEHPTEIKLTDSGRQVTGGGGITPDIVVAAPKLNKFEESLFRADVFIPVETGVGGFTRYYLGTKPTITKQFEVDDAVDEILPRIFSQAQRALHRTRNRGKSGLDQAQNQTGNFHVRLRPAGRLQSPARSRPPSPKSRRRHPPSPRPLPKRAQNRSPAHRHPHRPTLVVFAFSQFTVREGWPRFALKL